MSGNGEAQIKFDPKHCLTVKCPTCGVPDKIGMVFVHLPSANVVVLCKCGTLMSSIGISLESLRQLIELRLNQEEPARIVRPKFGPH